MAGNSNAWLRVQGDLRGLDKIIKRVEKIAGKKLVADAVEDVAVKAWELATEGVAHMEAPTGKPWPGRKDGKTLELPRKLSVVFDIEGTRIVIRVKEPWAVAHDRGAKRRKYKRAKTKGHGNQVLKGTGWKLPKRQVLPSGRAPRRWVKPILAVLNLTWSEFLKGKIAVGRKK